MSKRSICDITMFDKVLLGAVNPHHKTRKGTHAHVNVLQTTVLTNFFFSLRQHDMT